MKTELQKNATATFNELKQVLLSFRAEQINVIPYKDSWTPGQVAEHIIKSLSGFPKIIKGNVAATQREYDEKLEAIRNLFSNYSIKLKSPEFLLPSGSVHEQKALLQSLEERETETINIIETYNLNTTCEDFELPTFGTLTGFEWINFYIIHTQRHTQQLKKIFQRINNQENKNDAH